MTKSNIERELQKACKVRAQNDEDRQGYFVRMLDAALAPHLSDAGWEALSTGAQNWVNEGRTALNEEKSIPDFPDIQQEETTVEPATEKSNSKKSTTKAGKPKTEKPETEKIVKPAAGKSDKKVPDKARSTAPKDTGIKVRIKKMVLKKPSISVDEIIEKLKSDGIKDPSRMTVSAMRAEFRHSLHVLKGAGYLTDIEL